MPTRVMLPTLTALILGCGTPGELAGPLFDDRVLELPADFEGAPLVASSYGGFKEGEFARSAYSVRADSVDRFEYGDGALAGYLIHYGTPWEAQTGHTAAASVFQGFQPSVAGFDPTLTSYGTQAFWESGTFAATVYFVISRYCVVARARGGEEIPHKALQRALGFAESMFRVNDLLGTVPEKPVMLRDIEVTPTSGPLVPGQLASFSLSVSYTSVEGAEVVATVDLLTRVRERLLPKDYPFYTVAVGIPRGRTTRTVDLQLDLARAEPGDQVRIAARITQRHHTKRTSEVVRLDVITRTSSGQPLAGSLAVAYDVVSPATAVVR